MTPAEPRRGGRSTPRGRAIVPVLFFAALWALRTSGPEDWSTSAEASFLTVEERREWKSLDSRDSRERFIERYWLKRDPTPGTEKNEFRELVLARIKTADERFGMDKTPGSRTARGLVFLILGSPARVQDLHAPPPPPEPGAGRRLGQGVTPVALNEGNETTSTWYYDPDRTPRILEALRRPSLQVKIFVEPSRHRDAVQDPGLFDRLREQVARSSIVNPDLVPGTSTTVIAASMPALPRQALAPSVRAILEAAPAPPRSSGGFVGSAVVFHESGPAETLVWAYTEQPSRRGTLHLLVRDPSGADVAALSEPAAPSDAFSLRASGMVALTRLALAPGTYSLAAALIEEDGKALAAATLPVQVPALDREFAVSSLIVTRGPARASGGSNPRFTFAGTVIPPRADAVFTTAESLWYFVEIANPSDPAAVMLEPRLRRDGAPLAGLPAFPAALQPIGGGRFLSGVEVPLATLHPGAYVLYLTVRNGSGEESKQVLRRADFQIAGAK